MWAFGLPARRSTIPQQIEEAPDRAPDARVQEVLTMAEIKIEKKRAVPVWALLLGLILLVLLVWAALTMRDRNQEAPPDVALLERAAVVVVELPAAAAPLTFDTVPHALCA